MKSLKNYIFGGVSCLAIYWLSNSILWIPWKYATWLGAVCMLVYVPIAWGGISYCCLSKFKPECLRKAKYKVGILFAIISFLSDVFFYVGYRRVPKELFKPATFGAYFLCLIVPILCGFIMQKKKVSNKEIHTWEWISVGVALIVFIISTFYVVRFW